MERGGERESAQPGATALLPSAPTGKQGPGHVGETGAGPRERRLRVRLCTCCLSATGPSDSRV